MKMTPAMFNMIRKIRMIKDIPQVQRVPNNYLSFTTPSTIYFWNPEAKSCSMKMIPTILITIWCLSFVCLFIVFVVFQGTVKMHFKGSDPNYPTQL